jgi:hypothetical protein
VTESFLGYIDETVDALRLAEQLTREEPHGWEYVPTCDACGSQEGDPATNRETFLHKPTCPWKRLRDYFAAHPVPPSTGHGQEK